MKTTVRDSIGLPFTIFRARDSLEYDEAALMEQGPVAEAAVEGGTKLTEAGVLDGTFIRLLFARPGLSVSYAWFKSGFPLPRHSHNADCTYVIVAGSLKIGAEELGPGDGFFVGKDVPYTYTPGENGVEVLEFRTSDAFDIKVLANNPAWWSKALENLTEAKRTWPDQSAPPSGFRFS